MLHDEEQRAFVLLIIYTPLTHAIAKRTRHVTFPMRAKSRDNRAHYWQHNAVKVVYSLPMTTIKDDKMSH